jgi:cystathionine gamma-lyase
VFVSTFHTPGEPDLTKYTYARDRQPTWTELEAAIGDLEVDAGHEPASARVFASGLAAVAAVFGTVLGAGDTVVVQEGCYFGARNLLRELFEPHGVTVRAVAPEELALRERLAGAKLVWVETPGNPRLEVVDVRAVVQAARAVGALVAVDNTTATPLGQRPLELGADFSVCSDTKAMGGHSDVLMGHVATLDEVSLRKIERYRMLGGAIVGPMEAWLMQRSLATLPVRLERLCSNALTVAKFLKTRRQVLEVLYPGLESHPGHTVAVEQMTYFGPVLSFTLADKGAAERFLAGSKLVSDTTSFGGVVTTAERRARWGGDAVPEGLIRMSVGLEAEEDLIEDIGAALDGI